MSPSPAPGRLLSERGLACLWAAWGRRGWQSLPAGAASLPPPRPPSQRARMSRCQELARDQAPTHVLLSPFSWLRSPSPSAREPGGGVGDGASPRVGLSLSLGGHEEAASLGASPGLLSSPETAPTPASRSPSAALGSLLFLLTQLR